MATNKPKTTCIKPQNILKGPTTLDITPNEGVGSLFYKTMLEQMDKVYQFGKQKQWDMVNKEDLHEFQTCINELRSNQNGFYEPIDTSTGRTETSGSIREKAIKIAVAIKNLGIKPDDIAVIFTRPNADQTVVLLALFFIGAVVAPLDPDLIMMETKETLEKLQPKLLLTDLRNLAYVEKALLELQLHEKCEIIHLDGDSKDKKSYNNMLMTPVKENFQPFVVEDMKQRTALIIPTQGITSKPKLVRISDYGLLYQIYLFKDILFKGAERLLCFFPTSSIVQAILTCVCFVKPLVRILPGVFYERNAVRLIHDFKIDSALLGTNYSLRLIQHDSIKDFNLSCLKTVYVGGDFTTPLDIAKLRKGFPNTMIIHYYLITELGGLISSFHPEDYEAAKSNPAAAGTLMPGMKIKVMDHNSRQPLGCNSCGEILVWGPSIMLGYHKDQALTKASIDRGFFITGDIVEYDSQGFLYVLGRTSDMIERNNERFTGSEVEEIVLAHPFVKDVSIVANNKEIVACVIKHEDAPLNAAMLEEYMAEHMPKHKIPTRIKFFDDFPKTSIGKTRKSLLRQKVLGIIVDRMSNISVSSLTFLE